MDDGRSVYMDIVGREMKEKIKKVSSEDEWIKKQEIEKSKAYQEYQKKLEAVNKKINDRREEIKEEIEEEYDRKLSEEEYEHVIEDARQHEAVLLATLLKFATKQAKKRPPKKSEIEWCEKLIGHYNLVGLFSRPEKRKR